MTAQELLFTAYKHGVSITTDGKGNLRAAPANLVTPKFIGEIKANKGDLLPLVADLERCRALDDPIILEALALFNAQIAEVTQKAPATEQICLNLAA